MTIPTILGKILLLDFDFALPKFMGMDYDEIMHLFIMLLKVVIDLDFAAPFRELYLNLILLFTFDIDALNVQFFDEGAKQLLLMNSLLSFVKIVFVNLLNMWAVLAPLLASLQDSQSGKSPRIFTVPFGACVPGWEHIEQEKVKQSEHQKLRSKIEEIYLKGGTVPDDFEHWLIHECSHITHEAACVEAQPPQVGA